MKVFCAGVSVLAASATGDTISLVYMANYRLGDWLVLECDAGGWDVYKLEFGASKEQEKWFM